MRFSHIFQIEFWVICELLKQPLILVEELNSADKADGDGHMAGIQIAAAFRGILVGNVVGQIDLVGLGQKTAEGRRGNADCGCSVNQFFHQFFIKRKVFIGKIPNIKPETVPIFAQQLVRQKNGGKRGQNNQAVIMLLFQNIQNKSAPANKRKQFSHF